MYKDRFVEIDKYIIEGLNKAKQDCRQGMSSRSILTKAYARLIIIIIIIIIIYLPSHI